MEKIYMNFNSSSSSSIPPPLPPGFRFHPTDEELITRYLSPKVVDSSFRSTAVAEVDLNKVEPWDLPWKAKMGEKEWYFFCVRDRKYPNGSRANRATCCGYWKATGKDKEIFRGKKQLVGMKKTLVFYRGRAPKGEKSNWVMHEYRLQGQGNLNKFDKQQQQQQHEWVICRVFKKSAGGKKLHISRLGTDKVEFPPGRRTTPKIEGSHVTCFSNPPLNKSFDDECIPNSDSVFSMQDQSMLRLLLESNGPAKTEEDIGGDINTTAASNHQVVLKPSDHELGFNIYDDDDQDFPIDCLWNY